MELTLFREAPILREARHLPATIYNLAHLLLAHAGTSCAFVPIRTMQFLAIIDREEIVFVDRELPGQVQLAWQHFQPQARQALDERVAFEVAFYTRESLALLPRLMAEFPKAMQLLADREKKTGEGAVLAFPARGK